MKTIKAVSLWQPFASLIAIDEKRFETRSWQIPYRGPLAIHASKRWTLTESVIFNRFIRQFPDLAEKWNYTTDPQHPLPLGAVLCVCELVNVYPTTEIVESVSQRERAFGDFTPGRFAWELKLIQVLREPNYVRGERSLWDWKWYGAPQS